MAWLWRKADEMVSSEYSTHQLTTHQLTITKDMQFSFPKEKRLVSNRQFKAVLARGVRLSDGLLTLYMAKNDCGYLRLGVSVGKSCGNAVVRNRLKRLLREVFRQNQDRIPAGFDYLLMVSPPRFLARRPDLRRETQGQVKARAGAKKSGTGKTVRQGPRLRPSQPTFEQVKDSFLALVQELK